MSEALSQPSLQSLDAQQSIYLHLSAKSQLNIVQGQASLSFIHWIAERMQAQHLQLYEGQSYESPNTRWVCLRSSTALQYSVVEPESFAGLLRRAWRTARSLASSFQKKHSLR